MVDLGGSLGGFGTILDLLKREGGYHQVMQLPSTGNQAADAVIQLVKHASEYGGPSLKRPSPSGQASGSGGKISRMDADTSGAVGANEYSDNTGTTSGNNSLPTVGSMRCYSTMHISKFRLPFRGIITIPECDVYKTRQQFDEQDRVFLLDTFTLAPFMFSRAASGTGSEPYTIANIIFGHFDMWRPKAISYKLSHFKSTTMRTTISGGTNKNVAIGNPEGRICIATDSMSQVMNLQFSEDRAGVTIDEWVDNSVYTAGMQLPASNFGNPLYFSDVEWMNEQSQWSYTYRFDDIFLGKYWIKRLFPTTGHSLSEWKTTHIPLIPGNNTSGNISNNITYSGINGITYSFPNQQNQNSPVMLFCPRTGEYTEDETNPRLSATCILDAYLDVECAVYPWRQIGNIGSGWQNHESQFFVQYNVPSRANNSTPYPTYTHWFYNLPPKI